MRIAIICTHNSARSQLGEAIFRHLGKDRLVVASAGTEKTVVNPHVPVVLGECGISAEGLYSKTVEEISGMSFDRVITVCDRARESCPLLPGKYERIHWSLEDPAVVEGTEEEGRAAFRHTRNILKALARNFLGIGADTATLRCPHCGTLHRINENPADQCLAFYDCFGCGKTLRPLPGNCCVICSYSDGVCADFYRQVLDRYGDVVKNTHVKR